MIYKLENLNLKYDNKIIFNDFSLEIEKGTKYLIYGVSGQGKSTLGKLFLGFETNYTGKIYFKNEKIDSKNIWQIRKKVAYVAQEPDLGNGSVKNFIKSIFDFKSNKNLTYDENEILKYFYLFDLSKDIFYKNIETLSGGEKQRIAIIIALLLKRNIFILDEITSALDNDLKQKVIDYFLKQEQFTLIIISHNELWKQNHSVKIVNL